MRPHPNEPRRDARAGCIVPILPPGAVLRFTASRIPTRESPRSQAHERSRWPGVVELRSVLQRMHPGDGCRGATIRGRTVPFDSEWWSVRCIVHGVGVSRTAPQQRSSIRVASAACRVTAFLLVDGDDIRRMLCDADLERFQRYAWGRPFDADARRHLPIVLLLRLLRGRRLPPDGTADLFRMLARRERACMHQRVRSALRRLRQRMHRRAARS